MTPGTWHFHPRQDLGAIPRKLGSPSHILLPGHGAEPSPEGPDLPHQRCSQGQGLAGSSILSMRELLTSSPRARAWPELCQAGGAELQLQRDLAGPAAPRRCLGREAAATAARLAATALAPARGKGRVTLDTTQRWNEGARGWGEPAQRDQVLHKALLRRVEFRAPPSSLHPPLFPRWIGRFGIRSSQLPFLAPRFPAQLRARQAKPSRKEGWKNNHNPSDSSWQGWEDRCTFYKRGKKGA